MLTRRRFVNTLFVSIDGNFRLKNRAHTHGDKDPPLGAGMAFTIATELLREHLKNYKCDADVRRPRVCPCSSSSLRSSQISTCASFQALSLANLKLVRGNVATGIVAMICRHEFWVNQSITDTQKGERYVRRSRICSDQ